jgi:hypothetical protein
MGYPALFRIALPQFSVVVALSNLGKEHQMQLFYCFDVKLHQFCTKTAQISLQILTALLYTSI